MCGGQGTVCGNQFCLSTILDAGIELRSLGLWHVPLLAKSFLHALPPNVIASERIKFKLDSLVPQKRLTAVES